MSKISAALPLVLILHNAALVIADCVPRDCIDLRCHGLSSAIDGPHTIYPNTEHHKTLQVSCDQSKNDGGWMVFQRRSTEGRPVTFGGRSWYDYKHGFGDHGNETTELWLGNENVVKLLYMDFNLRWEILIEAYAQTGSECRFAATDFSLAKEKNEYAMDFERKSFYGCSPKYFNGLRYKPFRTDDHRGGTPHNHVCFNTHSAGWWYSVTGVGDCNEVFLNGPHQQQINNTNDSMFVKLFDEGKPLKGSAMLIRAMDATLRTCNNPCVNKPNNVCMYVARLKRHECICPSSMCGHDCKQTCEGGRHCEYDATNDVNECRCPLDVDGPRCTDVATTTSEPQKQSDIAILIVVLIVMLSVLAVEVACYCILSKKRRRWRQIEEADEESTTLLDATVAAQE